MGLWEEMAKDAPKVVREVGRPIVIGSTTYKAVVGPPITSDVLVDGGLLPQVNIEVKVLRADFTGGLPALNTKLVFNSQPLRIRSIVDQPPNPYVVLGCQHEDQ